MKLIISVLLLLFTVVPVTFADGTCDYFCRQEKVKEQVKAEVEREHALKIARAKIEVLGRLELLGAGDTYVSASSSATLNNTNTISQETNN